MILGSRGFMKLCFISDIIVHPAPKLGAGLHLAEVNYE